MIKTKGFLGDLIEKLRQSSRQSCEYFVNNLPLSFKAKFALFTAHDAFQTSAPLALFAQIWGPGESPKEFE
jgi:hypothetical protein